MFKRNFTRWHSIAIVVFILAASFGPTRSAAAQTTDPCVKPADAKVIRQWNLVDGKLPPGAGTGRVMIAGVTAEDVLDIQPNAWIIIHKTHLKGIMTSQGSARVTLCIKYYSDIDEVNVSGGYSTTLVITDLSNFGKFNYDGPIGVGATAGRVIIRNGTVVTAGLDAGNADLVQVVNSVSTMGLHTSSADKVEITASDMGDLFLDNVLEAVITGAGSNGGLVSKDNARVTMIGQEVTGGINLSHSVIGAGYATIESNQIYGGGIFSDKVGNLVVKNNTVGGEIKLTNWQTCTATGNTVTGGFTNFGCGLGTPTEPPFDIACPAPGEFGFPGGLVGGRWYVCLSSGEVLKGPSGNGFASEGEAFNFAESSPLIAQGDAYATAQWQAGAQAWLEGGMYIKGEQIPGAEVACPADASAYATGFYYCMGEGAAHGPFASAQAVVTTAEALPQGTLYLLAEKQQGTPAMFIEPELVAETLYAGNDPLLTAGPPQVSGLPAGWYWFVLDPELGNTLLGNDPFQGGLAQGTRCAARKDARIGLLGLNGLDYATVRYTDTGVDPAFPVVAHKVGVNPGTCTGS